MFIKSLLGNKFDYSLRKATSFLPNMQGTTTCDWFDTTE